MKCLLQIMDFKSRKRAIEWERQSMQELSANNKNSAEYMGLNVQK